MFDLKFKKLKGNILPYTTKQLLLLTCFLLVDSFSYGQTNSYREFNNITLSREASVVNCFIRDQQGIIWMGSDKGLFSYNGYAVQSHLFSYYESKNPANTKINCGILLDSIHLFLGSDNGILIYNLKTDQFEKNTVDFPSDVRSVVLCGDKVWIGSLNGLYRYRIKTNQLEAISLQKNPGIPHRTIYSLINTSQQTLYVGTYNGLCYLDSRTSVFHKIELPVQSSKNSLLVNALLEDSARQCIWVGTEGYLFKYFPKTKKVECINNFNGNSVKSLAIDVEKNLLIGTDNGLYIFNQEQLRVKHILHDSRYGKSLTNNIIWSIFVDNDKNAWFGTDYGVSLFKYNKTYRYVSISQLTGIGDGNQLQSIFKDSRGNFWYGGTNGLIFTAANSKNYIWYKMGDTRYPISHNRIRCIYEDKDRNLWVATDGSINRYNYATHQFIHYNIVDSTRTRNANWAYNLFEDKQGRLWIATCLGGIFVVDKQKLIQSTSGTYIAEQNYYKTPGNQGLSDNFINHVLSDLDGNVWALTYNNGINKIDTHTGKVYKFPIQRNASNSSGGNASCMMCDREGFIWVGFYGGLNRIDPKTNRIHSIPSDEFKENSIRVLTEENNHIWITSSDGTFMLDKKNLEIQHVRLINKPFSCSFYDPAQREIYLGGVDGFVVFSPLIVRNNIPNPSVILTGLYVNDRLFQAGLDYKGTSIRNAGGIKLAYDQNNVTFEFSDLSFSQDEDNKYLYQLEGVDNDWRTVKSNSNRISYTNLAPGSYILSIGRLDQDGKKIISLLDFRLTVSPPWYYSIWAKLFYAILIIGFVMWTINYFRDRHQMRIERIDKEKSLELSNLKIDFFTNVSHEFKTPLSLIIAPISKLLVESKNVPLKKQLSLIQQNALRLNSLIQQVIGFERFDGAMNNSLIFSHVEFIEFARGIFSVYEEAFREKKLTAEFVTDLESIVVNIDILKMESVLNNLISNACKFSTEGGSIRFEIHRSLENENRLIIQLSDSGIGIPREDVPYVFDRFFQSRKTNNDKVGSGIGLYLVRNYVELHSGTIQLTSEENKGTFITLILPVIESIAMSGINGQNLQSTVEIVSESDKPLVLIVEDNLEVCDFIVQNLTPAYRCMVAHNGKTGLDTASKNIPDLIIADVMMPVMNGMDMCKQLRKNNALALVPIIMLTAKDDKPTEEESMKLGVNAFMPKPFDTNMLLLRIKQLIGTTERLEEKMRLEALSLPKEIEAESWDEKWLTNITRIIEEKVADSNLNVNALSEDSGISSKQIYRKIKQLTGLTPVDYIRSIRMKKAAMLLAQKKFSVAEVMYLIGFSNYSYFSKCFHAKYGKTPKQFMES